MNDIIQDLLTVAESPFGGQALGLPCGARYYTGVWFISGLILYLDGYSHEH